MITCYTCKEEIPSGQERAWGSKSFKCASCIRNYNADRMSKYRIKNRPDDYEIPLHCQRNKCDDKGHLCKKCGIGRSHENFYKHNRKDSEGCGYEGSCKACRREPQKASQLARHFGISLEELNLLLAGQNNTCALCKEKETKISKLGLEHKLSIDHDHSCHPTPGKGCKNCIRGCLCSVCNQLIGMLEKVKPQLLEDMPGIKEYLKRRPLKVVA